MIIVRNQEETRKAIANLRVNRPEAIVGFVPTMGALHKGHMSLIQLAHNHSDIVVCSVFVNPTQFNNSNDLATYPRHEKEDIQLLEAHKCDILLLPGVADVYPDGMNETTERKLDLGGLDRMMEGAFRPGHFAGVCQVVSRFFEMVKPDKAFFGQKDFQQVAVIRKMTTILELPVEIIGAPIKRDEQGLALSSRNALLSPAEKVEALRINKALLAGIERSKSTKDALAIKDHILAQFLNSPLRVEYITIVNNDTLQEVDLVNENCTVCAAVFCGKVRLIDNRSFAELDV